MRVLVHILLLSALLLCGCRRTQSGGSARHERTVSPDGTVHEVAEYTAPTHAREASRVSIRPAPLGEDDDTGEWIAIDATFSGGYEPAAPEPQGRIEGQRILYGCAAVCGLLALGFVAFSHFKLALLSGVGAGGFVGAAVTADRYPILWLFGACAAGLLILVYVGWMLWRDYQKSGGSHGAALSTASAT